MTTTVQLDLPGTVAGQLVVSVKPGVMEVVRVKGTLPVLETVTVWVLPEVVVTMTGLAKLRVVGETVRLGLAEAPLTPG